MRDLLSSLSTNLHIVVIAMLIVGLGLGMITSSAAGGGKAKRDQSVITLSTTPSVPPRPSPDGSGSSGQSNDSPTPPKPSAGPSNGSGGSSAPHSKPSHPSHQSDTSAPPNTDVAAAPSPDDTGQLKLPCAMCDDTSQCPDSCLAQNQTALPWRRPEPPATICCGGKTVTIAYQPSFVICPTSCTDGNT